MAANHLIQQGYKSIGYIGLINNTSTGNERYLGFENAMVNAGLPIDPFWVLLGENDKCEQTGYEAIYLFHKANKIPDAICTANDRFALGAYKACKELSIDIPNQLGVVGMENIDITDDLSPGISSVDNSPFDLGRNSADLLINRIQQSDGLYQNITLEPKLQVRESTKKEQAK